MSKKVLTVNSDSIYRPYKSFGEHCTSIKTLFETPEEIALVAFPGGADVDPVLYEHKEHPRTYCSLDRDLRDLEVFVQAIEHGIPCVGICRGGQFLTVMSGGFLYQDVSGHGRDHLASTYDGKEIKVTSTHHQMFGLPLVEKAELLMWSTHRQSNHYHVERAEVAEAPEVEPEAVYYPEIGSLAVQWHPEWMSEQSDGWKYYQELLNKFVRPLTEKKHVFTVPKRFTE